MSNISADSSHLSKLSLARQLFYKSVENSQTIDEAITLFQQIAENEQYAGVASTYIGALIALKGKFAFLPTAKYSHVMKGLRLMDNGIEISPDNIEARFIRGMTCFYLPFFFYRKQTAQEDFEVVVRQLETTYHQYDTQIVLNIIDFLLKNIELSDSEINVITNIQNKIKQNEN